MAHIRCFQFVHCAYIIGTVNARINAPGYSDINILNGRPMFVSLHIWKYQNILLIMVKYSLRNALTGDHELCRSEHN